MTTVVKYDAMKVGELRALCKARGIDSDRMFRYYSHFLIALEKKDDLIAALRAADSRILGTDSTNTQESEVSLSEQTQRTLTSEEMREIATIADEMRHLRKQWLSQTIKSATVSNVSYGTSRK